MRLHFLLQLRNDFPQMNIYSSYDISYNHNHNHKMERYCGQTDWSNMQYTHTRVCPQSISFHHKWIFHGLHSFIHRFPFISFALGLHFSTLTHSFSLALSLSLLLQHVRTHTSISISIFQYVGDIIADCIICKFLYFIGSTKIHLPKPMKQ